MICDFHVHTCMSSDSDADIKMVIEKAISLGMKYLCITDHHDIDYEDGTFLLNPADYYNCLASVREQFRDRVQLLIGVELGLQPHLKTECTGCVHSVPCDFVIGSSHVINGIDPYYEEIWNTHSSEEVMTMYFENILANLSVHTDFDVYGHLDYAIRYAKEKDKNYSYEKYKNIIDRILETILSLGKGIEINTAGLRKGLRSTNPCFEIVKRYRELGGKIITVGSDAHVPEDIGSDFSCARQLLVEAGFTHYYIFKERMPYALPL